jgi:hypothetical protein
LGLLALKEVVLLLLTIIVSALVLWVVLVIVEWLLRDVGGLGRGGPPPDYLRMIEEQRRHLENPELNEPPADGSKWLEVVEEDE